MVETQAQSVQVFIAAQVLQFDSLDLVIVQVELMKTVRKVFWYSSEFGLRDAQVVEFQAFKSARLNAAVLNRVSAHLYKKHSTSDRISHHKNQQAPSKKGNGLVRL